MAKTKIEWTNCTWNFITGCTQVSPACKNCYAKAMTKRLQGMALKNIKGSEKYILGWDKMIFHTEVLKDILDKKKYPKGSKVFVNSMSDTFHEDISLDDIWDIFYHASQRQDLIFQFLTKRPKQMIARFGEIFHYLDNLCRDENSQDYFSEEIFKHCWFGVTAENQKMADERIPELLKLRELFGEEGKNLILFVSIEPMLEAINLRPYLKELDWVIVGGENAPKGKARLMKIEWVDSIELQCESFKVPLFFKQWGNNIDDFMPFRLDEIKAGYEKHKEFPLIRSAR